MKKTKQILAVLLSIILMFTSMPSIALQAMAQSVGSISLQNNDSSVSTDKNSTVSIDADNAVATIGKNPVLYATATSDTILLAQNGGITRAEWLHNLVVTFGMTVESTALPDNYFSDLDESHKYYEDILLAVEFGVVDIAAGGELDPDGYVTREFAASTLNFCLGYQLDENAEYTFNDSADCTDPASAQIALDRGWFKPISGKFNSQTYITSDEINTMLADAEQILAGQVIDENYDSTYDFAEDVVIVPDGTLVTEDLNGVISITDCPVTIKKGNSFAVYFNGIPTVYTANSVTVVGNVTSINTSAVEADQAFDAVDAQGVVDLDAIEITPVDGAEVSVETQEISTFSADSKKIGTINLSKKVDFAPGIQGSVSVKIHNPVVEYSVSSDYVFVALTGDTTVTYNLSMDALESAGLSKSITIATCSIGGIGSFDVTVNFDVSGSATGSVSGYMIAGIECRKGDAIRAVKSFSQSGYYTNVEATANVGLNIKLGVTRLPIVTAYVYAEVGANAKLSSSTYSSGAPRNCTHFAAYLYAKYGASASVKFLGWSKSFNKNYDIFNYSNSPVRVVHHYEDGVPVARCARGTNYDNYFTYGTSRWGGCGWISADGAYGLNPDGTVFPLYNYTVEDGKATITKYNANSWSVYIPKELDGYSVVAIGNSAFKAKDVGYVVVPDTVTTIKNSAFADCYSLYDINLPNSLTLIEGYSFANCSSLVSVSIPDGITNIQEGTFYNATSLKNVKLPKSLIELGGAAFCNTGIESIEIPKTLDKCGAKWYYEYNFEGQLYGRLFGGPFLLCEKLKNVTFEEGTTQIAENLFRLCTGLEEVVIPDTVTKIENCAFENCFNLKSATIGNSVTEIGDYAFSSCYSLTKILIPDCVTNINARVFSNCSKLTDVTLSKKLVYLGGGAFLNTAIKSIEIPKSLDSGDDTWYFEYKFGDKTYGGLFGGPFTFCDDLKTITFEDGTTQIAENLFRLCTGLEEVVIPDTVTTIENCAFDNCFNLKSVTIGNSVTKIGDYAFSSCLSLTEITIPNSVTNINGRAFANCEKLKDVTLSKNLKYMGGAIFLNTAIESIEIPKTLEKCDTSWYFEYEFGDKTYGRLFGGPFTFATQLKTITFEEGTQKIPQQLFRLCTGLEEVVIPDTVTTIGVSAFEDCFNLKKVTIGNNVTLIENGAFYLCASLNEVIIPDSVTSMGTSCFEGCSSLESVKLPKDLNGIVSYSFKNCTSLKEIELPQTVTTIQKEAFYGCTALKEIVLPELVKTVDSSAFQNCTSLEKVYIPQSTKNIYSKAFMGCEKLTDVTIADYSITTITSQTFKDCAALEKITLPKGLTKIESQAFNNCTSLKEVYIPESVTSIDTTAFSYPDKTTVYGKTGSYAETFANDNGFKFVDNTVAAMGISLVDGIESIVMNKGDSYRAVFEFFPEDSTDVITLTANNSNVSFSGHDIYANLTGETIVTATASSGVTYEFSITIRDAKSIAITNQPAKLSYLMGEELDTTGMTVQVTYTDGTVEDITDYTVTGFDSSREGDCTVTVQWVSAADKTYKTTFTVNIVDPRPKLTGIVIETLPTKLAYERKEALDLSGMVVKASYTDGSVKEITDYTCSGYNALKNGAQTITVTYGDYTATFTVTVGITLESIEITSLPKTTKYGLGDELNTDGLVLTLTYSDGSTTTITEGFTVSGFDSETVGEKTVVVSYGNFSDTFTVTIRDKSAIETGDINGDGNINNKDLGLLMQYLNNWNVEIVTDAADTNGDGKVNNKDYGLLMQYLNGWDIELG